jgi:hypothetical protein
MVEKRTFQIAGIKDLVYNKYLKMDLIDRKLLLTKLREIIEREVEKY